ncbi:hypothetical protein NDU88_005714 [Pleurodeles waltl]|uniref:Uncharacterized protein n=1 Tax=Pleurodeles waltl TaxID=8319 RepID=A0AAV7W8L5_PLEWA|nr:hypothetical protein NDU88_005714 [Pleurodeles waltl]
MPPGGEDWNLARDAVLDQTGRLDISDNANRTLWGDVLKDQGLVDRWHLSHPLDREHTFMSPIHGTQSWLFYYFLVSHKLVLMARVSQILEASISDHAPVHLVLELGLISPGRKPWHLNASRYCTPQGKDQFHDHVTTYVTDNRGSVASPQVFWAAAKSTIIGQLMRDATLANAQNRSGRQDLEEMITSCTRKYTATPSPATRSHLEKAKIELNALYTSKAGYALQRLKGRHYEQGEKAGRLLAAQLRQLEAALAIHAI